MSLTRRSLRFSIILLLVGFVGCGLLATNLVPIWRLPFVRSDIQRLQARSQAVDGATVYLQGVVGDRVPLVNQQVYQLQDETGSIWVLTDDVTLQSGDTILLKGRVQFQSIPINDQELGEIYIEEQKQLERNGVPLK